MQQLGVSTMLLKNFSWWKKKQRKELNLLCHRAAQIGEFSIVKMLLSKGANSAELDEDNWSWADYGRRFSDKDIDLFEELSQDIQHIVSLLLQNKAKGPSTFAVGSRTPSSITSMTCETLEHNHQPSTFTG